MTESALDLITKSLKRIGVIAGTETPSADLAQDALDRLNALIETWSTESLTLWTQETFQPTNPLQASKLKYTFGPGGDIDIPVRPPWIDSASLLMSGTPAYESVLTPYSRQEWEVQRQKLLTSTQPTHYYYKPFWPLGELYFWPVYDGTAAIVTVWFYLPIPFVGPATYTTLLDYPPGYSRALRDALAIELAPELGRPVDGALVASATEAKAQLQRVNYRPRELHLPAALASFGNCGGFDWRTGDD